MPSFLSSPPLDTSGNVPVDLASLIAGEDLTNNVMGTDHRPISGGSYSPSLYAPITQVTKNIIKSTSGNAFSVYITNDNATVRYFQMHNLTAAPAGAAVPYLSQKIPAGTANNPGVLLLSSTFFTEGGLYFSNGIAWSVSTTFGTFTDSATSTEHVIQVLYI